MSVPCPTIFKCTFLDQPPTCQSLKPRLSGTLRMHLVEKDKLHTAMNTKCSGNSMAGVV